MPSACVTFLSAASSITHEPKVWYGLCKWGGIPLHPQHITTLRAIHKPPNQQTLQHFILISKWRYLSSPALATLGGQELDESQKNWTHNSRTVRALEPETKMTHLKVFQKLHFHQIWREVTTAVVRLWRFTQWLKNAIFWRVSLPPGVCRGWRNEMGLLQMDTPWASVWTDTADVFLYMPCHVGHTKLNLTFYNPKMFPRSLWHLTSEKTRKSQRHQQSWPPKKLHHQPSWPCLPCYRLR